jgi:hypothetical protein
LDVAAEAGPRAQTVGGAPDGLRTRSETVFCCRIVAEFVLLGRDVLHRASEED